MVELIDFKLSNQHKNSKTNETITEYKINRVGITKCIVKKMKYDLIDLCTWDLTLTLWFLLQRDWTVFVSQQ